VATAQDFAGQLLAPSGSHPSSCWPPRRSLRSRRVTQSRATRPGRRVGHPARPQAGRLSTAAKPGTAAKASTPRRRALAGRQAPPPRRQALPRSPATPRRRAPPRDQAPRRSKRWKEDRTAKQADTTKSQVPPRSKYVQEVTPNAAGRVNPGRRACSLILNRLSSR